MTDMPTVYIIFERRGKGKPFVIDFALTEKEAEIKRRYCDYEPKSGYVFVTPYVPKNKE